jgi:hypothetical protein
MQDMLSAPRPSEAAKFIGQILSIINSTILERTTVLLVPTLPVGELPEVEAEVEFVFVRERADGEVVLIFFIGDIAPLRVAPAAAVMVLGFMALTVPPFFRSLYFVS